MILVELVKPTLLYVVESGGTYPIGSVVEVSDDLATDLIAGGSAVLAASGTEASGGAAGSSTVVSGTGATTTADSAVLTAAQLAALAGEPVDEAAIAVLQQQHVADVAEDAFLQSEITALQSGPAATTNTATTDGNFSADFDSNEA